MVDMAEEKENNNNIVMPRLGMVSDTLPEEQPDNTYRMALNAVAEDYDDKGALRTEESNALCIAIPVEEKTYHITLENCCNDDDSRHIVFESEYNKNNIPQRHYLPALRMADSKPGLYDIINNQFYTNAGTGEFLYA